MCLARNTVVASTWPVLTLTTSIFTTMLRGPPVLCCSPTPNLAALMFPARAESKQRQALPLLARSPVMYPRASPRQTYRPMSWSGRIAATSSGRSTHEQCRLTIATMQWHGPPQTSNYPQPSSSPPSPWPSPCASRRPLPMPSFGKATIHPHPFIGPWHLKPSRVVLGGRLITSPSSAEMQATHTTTTTPLTNMHWFWIAVGICCGLTILASFCVLRS
jgi:hypothetical protein